MTHQRYFLYNCAGRFPLHISVQLTLLYSFMAYSVTPRRVDSVYIQWLIRAALAEFVGIGLFVFLSAGSVVATGKGFANDTVSLPAARILAIAFGHGISIALMVAAIGGISGGHINPAVTLSFLVTGRLDILTSFVYIVSQILGALAGAGFLRAIFPKSSGLGHHFFGPTISTGKGFLIETILTFVLVFVIWGTAVDPKGPSSIAALCIGLAVFVDHIVGIPLTGPSLNPARTFATAIWSGKRAHQWVYWLAPCLGGVLAGLFYNHVLLYKHRPLQEDVEEELDGKP